MAKEGAGRDDGYKIVEGLPEASAPSSTAPVPRRKKRLLLKIVLLLLGLCLVFGAMGIFLVRQLRAVYFLTSAAMEPTLLGPKPGQPEGCDYILVDKVAYRNQLPKFGDIIVFNAPKEADLGSLAEGKEPQEIVMPKRVIGLPGDTIEVKEGPVARDGVSETACFVYRNGERLNELYIKEPMEAPQPMKAIYGVGKPLKLGPDQLFVMGDNRNDSNDSRYWGPLDRTRLLGKVTDIIAPPERVRSLP